MNANYDVIVVGAGHAGCEAAAASANMGSRVLLVTMNMQTIGQMSCNPAIGGTAKGHLVREVDALGGLMGRAIDATGIQFKLLNRSRGPAVWSPRAQADKELYRKWIYAALEAEPNVSWIFGRAGRVLRTAGRISGLAMEDGDWFGCEALVVTTGTFLNGLVHIGDEIDFTWTHMFMDGKLAFQATYGQLFSGGYIQHNMGTSANQTWGYAQLWMNF